MNPRPSRDLRLDPGHDAPDFVVQRVHEQNVALIELWVTDPLGALHVIEVPREALADALVDGFFAGPSLASALHPAAMASELYLVPDPMSFQHVSRQRRSARLFCDVHLPDGSPWPLCVRSRLKRTLSRVAQEGATFYLGASSTQRWLEAPATATPLTAPRRQQQLAAETAAALESLAIPWRCHRRVEGETRDPSRWLFELDLVDPLTLADSIATLRRIAEVSAHADGAGVTWMPHPWEGVSRATLDLSVTRLSALEGPSPTFADPLHPLSLSLQARSVMQAIGASLGPLSLVLRSTVNSYTRPDPMVVLPSPMSRSETGAALWVAGADACSNPYLMSALLVSLAHDSALTAARSEEVLAMEPAPQTLVEAARVAESSPLYQQVLGTPLTEVLVARARLDAARWRSQVTAFEVERYL